MNYRFIDPDEIKDMLFNEAEYIIEFCEAGISSLDEFMESYSTHLLNRDMENLRRAGHKVKPGTQMMGANEVAEKYEQGKKLIAENADKETLETSVNEMKELCQAVKQELNHLADNQK